MAIHPKCVQALAQAAGKPLTQGQLDEIERRMRNTATQLARADPQAWHAKSKDQRILEAAQQAAIDVQAEAQHKANNARLQIVKTVATDERIKGLQKTYSDDSRTTALVRDMQNVENQVQAIGREYASQILDTVNAVGSGQGAGIGRRTSMFLFDVDNPAMTRDLAAEIFAPGSTGNKIASAGAKAWLDTIEGMRQRFNAAGGDVGKLDYGYLPQPHDSLAALRAGKDKWAADTLPLLDRSRYLKEDGARMNDAEVTDFLKAAWESIASNGQNKRAPGEYSGTGARANRGGDSREIHFASGDAYLNYLSSYGNGSMYDAMMSHINARSKDIGLVEAYGPNPSSNLRLQIDLAERADGGTKRQFGTRPQTYADLLLGNTTSAAGTGLLARTGQEVRGVQTAGKLAGALLSSVTDLGTYFISSGFNRLPYWDSLVNIGKANTGEARRWLNSHGLMADTMLHEMNRWTAENVRRGVFTRMANATMRLSLLNAWTDSLRRGFQLTMMQGMGRLHGKEWGKLSEFDRFRMEAKGITEADWQAFNSATPQKFNGFAMVTPEDIRAVSPGAATKYLSLILDESHYAVINPDMATRALVTGGLQAGTVKGELWRSAMQFKSFPLAMVSRHWRRAADTPADLDGMPVMGNRLAYYTAMGVSLTALGAISVQVKQLVQGKDPIDMTNPKFWIQAAAQGGATGFYGDLLLSDSSQTQGPSDSLFRLLGPTAGSVADLYELTKGNLDEALAGKPTHAGAEALRFAKSHTPFVNLWYARGAIERGVLNDLQENMSPGYLQRMKSRARKQWGQEYWWDPAGGVVPERAPDFAEAIGQ